MLTQWFQNIWRKQQRGIDLATLWPACRDQAPDLDTARAAFAAHAFHDPAWLALGAAEVTRVIEGLS